MDTEEEDWGHPDSAIRLASAVHRFKMPQMSTERRVRFGSSFHSSGKQEKTRKVMLKADDSRNKLKEALIAGKVSHERVVAEARRYQPLIHQILVSCKVQPEMARLDERLVFEWLSGVESSKKSFKSEAIMFDLVMCIVCEGLGKAGVATETSVAGEFAAASREYAAAAGIFCFLAEDHLPKWVARGSQQTDAADLPVECHVDTAKGLNILFKANAQQMAVATVLIKPGTPNYSLLAKLCLGIADQMESYISHMRDTSFDQMTRIEKDFFILITFQTFLQKGLSSYFMARSLWEEKDYGMAIAFLSEATVLLKTRDSSTSPGMPEVSKVAALKPLHNDLIDLRGHMNKLLKRWETDNSSVYFETVPRAVPLDRKLQTGIHLGKEEKFKISSVEPVLLSLTAEALKRSDSDLARELQEKLNAGLE